MSIQTRANAFLYGADNRWELLFSCIPRLLDYVEGFITADSTIQSFMGKRVYNIKNLNQFFDRPIVATFYDKTRHHIADYQNMKLSVGDRQIIPARSWIANILLSDSSALIKPSKVRLEACTECQLKCTSCYMRLSNYGSVGKGYLIFDNFKRFVDENSFIKQIELSNNGEVFLNPDLIRILRYAKKHSIDISISNGTNFNYVRSDVMEGLVRYGVKQICISIDGACQNVYSKYRVGGNFDKVISNIKKLCEYKEKYNTVYPELVWQYILMEHNEKDIELAKHISQKFHMNILYKLDWDGRYIPKDPAQVKQVTGLTTFNRIDWKKRTGKAYVSDMCQQMIFRPQINYDGRLLGCCGVYLDDWNINVFQNSFIRSLNEGSYFQALIDFLTGTPNKQLNSICSHCSAKLHSYGDTQVLNI